MVFWLFYYLLIITTTMLQKTSVCMATYNGAAFIENQINSIVTQMNDNDELIICDDCSTDNTVEIIKSYQDERIRLYQNVENLGHVKNFEKAISLATGELIALSDQDDVWLPKRLQQMQEVLSKSTDVFLVASNFDMLDTSTGVTTSFQGLDSLSTNQISRVINIFLGNIPYFGCTFLMRKELVNFSIPFPPYIEAHDIWIALVANTYGKVVHMEQPTLCRRLHGGNLTPSHRRSIPVIIKGRITLLYSYFLFLLTRHKKHNIN
jgi:glycosyltransferase involved in cell wall biosynthesis